MHYIDRNPEPLLNREKRIFLSGVWRTFVVFYIVVGLLMGAGMNRAIPAINAKGVAYITVTWPGFVVAAAFGTPNPPVPSWAFSFEDR